MPSFTTAFRAIVMLAAGVIVVKGWQLYGPSAEQMKSFTARAVELAQQAWSELAQSAGPNASLAAEPQAITPPLVPLQPASTPQMAGATSSNAEAPIVSNEPVASPMFSQSATGQEELSTSGGIMPALTEIDGDRLPALLARLEALGGVDAQLVEWGSGGELYRFHCRAALADTPNFSRHFESVAAEPLVAVEQVVAKVEAWRTAQRDEGSIR